MRKWENPSDFIFSVSERRHGPILVGVLHATELSTGRQWEQVYPTAQTAEIMRRRYSAAVLPPDFSSWTATPAPARRAPKTPKTPKTPSPRVRRAAAEAVAPPAPRVRRAAAAEADPALSEERLYQVAAQAMGRPDVDALPDVEDIDINVPWLCDVFMWLAGAPKTPDMPAWRSGLTRDANGAVALHHYATYGWLPVREMPTSQALRSSSDSALRAYLSKRLAADTNLDTALALAAWRERGLSADEELSLLLRERPRRVAALLAYVVQREIAGLRRMVTDPAKIRLYDIPPERQQIVLDALDSVDLSDV